MTPRQHHAAIRRQLEAARAILARKRRHKAIRKRWKNLGTAIQARQLNLAHQFDRLAKAYRSFGAAAQKTSGTLDALRYSLVCFDEPPHA